MRRAVNLRQLIFVGMGEAKDSKLGTCVDKASPVLWIAKYPHSNKVGEVSHMTFLSLSPLPIFGTGEALLFTLGLQTDLGKYHPMQDKLLSVLKHVCRIT